MPADASAADAAARRDAATTSAANAPGVSASETANLHAAGVSSDFFAQGQSFTSAIHRHQRSVAATAPAAASRSGGAASAAMAHLCQNQPLVWVVLTKLENSLARSNQSRFG